MTLEPYYIIHKFQIWRIFTWIMIPETPNILFFAIMLLLYYQLGTALENAWGTFRFNAYIIGGMLATLIGAFVLYFIYGAVTGSPVAGVGGYFSMQYINLSIFLAFAVCFPDMEVLLYFIISDQDEVDGSGLCRYDRDQSGGILLVRSCGDHLLPAQLPDLLSVIPQLQTCGSA